VPVGRVLQDRGGLHLFRAPGRIPATRKRRISERRRRRDVDVFDRRDDRLRRFERFRRHPRKRIGLFDQRQSSSASMVVTYIDADKCLLSLHFCKILHLRKLHLKPKTKILFFLWLWSPKVDELGTFWV